MDRSSETQSAQLTNYSLTMSFFLFHEMTSIQLHADDARAFTQHLILQHVTIPSDEDAQRRTCMHVPPS